MNHTQGPWKAIEHDRSIKDYQHFCIHNEGNGQGETVIATLQANRCWNIPLEQNARLIAAAPELLEALKQAITSLEWAAKILQVPVKSAYREDIASAISAINKAEGKG